MGSTQLQRTREEVRRRRSLRSPPFTTLPTPRPSSPAPHAPTSTCTTVILTCSVPQGARCRMPHAAQQQQRQEERVAGTRLEHPGAAGDGVAAPRRSLADACVPHQRVAHRRVCLLEPGRAHGQRLARVRAVARPGLVPVERAVQPVRTHVRLALLHKPAALLPLLRLLRAHLETEALPALREHRSRLQQRPARPPRLAVLVLRARTLQRRHQRSHDQERQHLVVGTVSLSGLRLRLRLALWVV